MVNNTMLDLDFSAGKGIIKIGVGFICGQVKETCAHSGWCRVQVGKISALW